MLTHSLPWAPRADPFSYTMLALPHYLSIILLFFSVWGEWRAAHGSDGPRQNNAVGYCRIHNLHKIMTFESYHCRNTFSEYNEMCTNKQLWYSKSEIGFWVHSLLWYEQCRWCCKGRWANYVLTWHPWLVPGEFWGWWRLEFGEDC